MKQIYFYILLFIVAPTFYSCAFNSNYISQDFSFNVDLNRIDTSNIKLKIGDIFTMDYDSIKVDIVLLDFDIEYGKIYYGVTFIKDEKIFGRQVPDGTNNLNCLDLIDFFYLNKKTIKSYIKKERVDLAYGKLELGLHVVVSNHSELIGHYNYGLTQRNKPQTPCNKGLINPNSIRECYFNLDKYKQTIANNK